MIEYYLEAIALNKEETEDLNGLFLLFTDKHGKVRAKAVSSRKLTSKLAGHLEPGTLLRLRLGRRSPKNGFRIIESLAIQKNKNPNFIRLLEFVDKMTPFMAEDNDLFEVLKKMIFLNEDSNSYTPILKVLGFDPAGTECDICGNKIAYFSSRDIIFLCRDCGERAKKSDLVPLLP